MPRLAKSSPEASERLAGEISRLDAEAADNRVETERVASEREVAGEALRAAQGAIETARAARAAREADLATARIEREWRVNEQRTRERELAGLVARLHSLEELQSAREGYTDAAKAILADASLGIRHHGAVVDAMEADSTTERLAEACLGDILEYVLVSSHDEAHRGLDVLRQKQLGRCGFVVIGDQAATSGGATPDGCQSLWSLLRVGGPQNLAQAVDLAGYPNGRRPNDDVVDISLVAVLGGLCVINGDGNALGLNGVPGVSSLSSQCKPSSVPLGATSAAVHDAVDQATVPLLSAFPYLATPIGGTSN